MALFVLLPCFRASPQTHSVLSMLQANCLILKELIDLRAQKSALLGFSTHADFVLEMNMAKNCKTVSTFLGNVS